ncbi:helix-turn-helix domain-containing protein [Actinoplanes sp. NPDC049596]|uniref:helix-turn-helix domain-containing protein n=1 Tax=unclassified Actinoplanes TaxID=2626549 RepID=UPI00341908B7
MTLPEQGGLGFGGRLRELRVRRGLTIEGLAEASGVSARAISDMERGRSRAPRPRTVAALSGALGGDGTLVELARAGRETSSAGRPRMCDLPRRSGHFVGRGDELAAIAEHWADVSPVTVVHGAPGVGKTGLALKVAELHEQRFPDGRFYLDLRGTEPGGGVPVGEAQTMLLRALGVSSRLIARGEPERTGQLRAILAERRCLVILDNAGREAQVRGLMGATTVVTSRRVLGGLEAVRRVALAPLSTAEAVELLGEAGSEETARLCGCLPLALRIAATLDDQNQLTDPDRRLEVLTPVENAFDASYRHLPETARTVFRRLAHVPTLSFSAAAAAVLAERDLYDAEDVLEELLELGLLQPEGHDRYRFHDLIRLYARARLRAEESAAVRRAAEQRLVGWYLDTAIAAGRWFEPAYGKAPGNWRHPVPLDTRELAQAWLQAEVDGWFEAMRRAAAAGDHQRVVDVAESLHWYSDRTYTVDPWGAVYAMSRESAARLPDRLQEVVHLNYQAWASASCDGLYSDSAAQALEAYGMAVELGDVREQAIALKYAADGYNHNRDHARAIELMTRSLELAEAAGDHDGYLQTMVAIGEALEGLERLEDSVAQYRATLAELERRPLSPPAREVAQLTATVFLAYGLTRLKRWDEAAATAHAAMPLARTFGEPLLIALVHLVLGLTEAAAGHEDQARAELTRTVELTRGRNVANSNSWIKVAEQALAELSSA